MSGHALHSARDKVVAYGARLVDVVYQASVFSVIGYGVILLFLLIIAAAVALNLVTVPEFHPR